MAAQASRFHGITAVAELKGREPAAAGGAAAVFPRHHSRGRIEGRTPATEGCSSSRGFHGITAVAELKGEVSFVPRQYYLRFPRHHSRGRIEGHPRRTSRLSDSRFHGITAVAELKAAVLNRTDVCLLCFHGITAVAELKGEVPVQETVRAQPKVSTASQPWPN